MKRFLLVVIGLVSFSASAGKLPLFFSAGANLGGPVPVKTVEGSTGKVGVHANLGVGYRFSLSSRFSFQPSLSYHLNTVQYSQRYKKDTLVAINVLGTTQYVPTYYYGNVDGRLRVHYLDLNLPVYYSPVSNTSIFAGLYLSAAIAAYDKGQVLIQVGEGNFFDDFTQLYNNASNIRKWDTGIQFGVRRKLLKSLHLGIKVSRGFTPFYKPHTFDQRGLEEVKMYNTVVFSELSFVL